MNQRSLGTAILKFIISSVILLTLPNAFASANWENQSPSDYQLPDPPDAKESAIEIDVLLKLQDERTDEECKLGQKQRSPGFSNLFSGTALLSSKDIKTLSPLMKRVSAVGEKISQAFKKQYQRIRPYDFDSRLQPCVAVPGGHKSYPSSHATISTLDACVLSVIFTDKSKQKAFRELGAELSLRRMKIGVHFPSDVEAGKNLGLLICHNLAQDAEFVTEAETIRSAL